jgi:uncharacterized protein (DUF58 family)
MRKLFKIDRRAWFDFLLTLVLLGVAFVLAFMSSFISRTGEWVVGAFSALAALVLALGCGVYIVPRLARRVRWELWGFGIRTSVTSEGYLFLLIAVVVGVAAWNTENNLLYLILAMLLAFVIVSGNTARLMLHDVGVQLRFPDHIFAGEAVHLAVTLANRKQLLPSVSVTVEANARRTADPEPPRGRWGRRPRRAGTRLAHFILVPRRATVRQVVEHVFDRRGVYRIETFTLSTKFPAGFFKKWREVAAAGEIVVFPPVKPVDDFFHTLPIVAGASSSHVRGDGVDVFAFRDYQPTDHIRRIDWKASARSQRFVVRETALEEDFHLTIYFDPRRPDDAQGGEFAERFERGVEMAASLARHFILEGADVEIATPDNRVESGTGPGHLYRLLAVLAAIEPSRPGDGPVGAAPRELVDLLPGVGDEHRFKVLFTSAPKGSLPAAVWRSAHVVYIDDL